jgi:NitT/TauT family transport system permease protein
MIWVGIIILALLATALYAVVSWLEHRFMKGQIVKTI